MERADGQGWPKWRTRMRAFAASSTKLASIAVSVTSRISSSVKPRSDRNTPSACVAVRERREGDPEERLLA
jgi:hypothetical protein